MNFQDYIRYDAVGLAELIRKKEVSADEVLQAETFAKYLSSPFR